MLKLKKLQILGFKSFCDRTDVALGGDGIAAIVGPNGCGKSNIADAISWVLGEQSAKSLRSSNMQDVIFNGTRDRKPTGMAEVSLTLVDPDVYDGAPLFSEPEVIIDDLKADGDWDETALRTRGAEETEAATLEAQPGQVIDEEEDAEAVPEAQSPEARSADGTPAVILKIRRRKFNQAPVRAGEITVTRRLFRSGDSEYLLNGKLCRLGDIRDIFMGTGLGPESYAIIEQDRIYQLLSSKPHDRRAIIEEAAGVTRFKTKKRLAELRLEQAKQNLSRINDIFDEVTRQMNSLKRQAAKAERYAALRDELRARLHVVFASKLTQMDAESASLSAQSEALGAEIEVHTQRVTVLETTHAAGMSRGYELDAIGQDATARANAAAVELERAAARTASNIERIAELNARIAGSQAELEQVHAQLASAEEERNTQRAFLAGAAAETAAGREQAQQQRQQSATAAAATTSAEMQLERAQRESMQMVTQATQARNAITQAEETLANLEADAARLISESDSLRRELEALGTERGQTSLAFESVTQRLTRLESEIGTLRSDLNTRRAEEHETRRRGDQLRAEQATLLGRRSSLEALLREHSYSTDTVRQLFRANSMGGSLTPAGVLADFLEVDRQYESVVDEFMRDELNFIVVKSWDAAHEGMRLLKSDVDGRATFLVHPNDSQAKFSFLVDETLPRPPQRQGVVQLKECIRVLDGFGKSLEVILPKLRDGFVTPDSETARTLALENPDSFFLSPNGECFHNVTVTGGKPRAEGPLALKRELREAQQKLEAVEQELAHAENSATRLSHLVAELTRTLDTRTAELREAERESANAGAALQQMQNETGRLERRLEERLLEIERNKNSVAQKRESMQQNRDRATELEAQHALSEQQAAELRLHLDGLRAERDQLQQLAAASAATLAALEERQRGAAANADRLDRSVASLSQRVGQMESQLAASAAEITQRANENEQLQSQQHQTRETRESALAEAIRVAAEATKLRASLIAVEQELRTLRLRTDELREQRSSIAAHAAKLSSDIEHLEAACLSELNLPARDLRIEENATHLSGEMLREEDAACQGLRQKLEAMGPVNMMALEEYKETAERHTLLETQRRDLVESIENTHSSIREIDQITQQKFEEAFARINENFSVTFSKLFGGGQAFMRLTDETNSAESGIELVASPPGKRPQNVLLLSGGEKALTAVSLLLGIFQYQPAPFCVLDEVDAPLDETNVGRLADMLKEMSAHTQFVMITHSKRTMTAADMIYGVTMQEPGVSKIVSVRLGHHDTRRVTAATA